MNFLHVFVPGNPAPQGSKRHLGRGILVESSKALRPWRESIRWTIAEHWHTPALAGAVVVTLMFVMPRPKSARKGATHAIKRPDIDKLARACLDAIQSAGVYGDDAQVTFLVARKRLAAPDETPGVLIEVEAA